MKSITINRIYIAVIISYLAIMTIALSGCSTVQKLIDKAEKKDPVAVAKYTREKYPCTELLRRDTTTVTQDSIIYIDCPQNGTEADYSDKGSGGKTGTSEPATNPQKAQTVAVHIPVTVKYIDRWFEDSAKIFGLTSLIMDQQKLLLKSGDTIRMQKATIAERDATIKKRNKREWIMLAIILGLGVWTFRKIF